MPAAPEPSILASILPILFWFGVEVAIAFAAANMAKKRGLKQNAAFFAGFFGSIIALCIIGMFPVKEKGEKQ